MRPEDRKEFDATLETQDPIATAAAITNASGGTAFTAYENDIPVFTFGLFIPPQSPRLATLWGFGTTKTKRVIPTITKFARRFLTAYLLNRTDVQRIEVRVLEDHKSSVGWIAKLLKGTLEARNRQYGTSGETFLQFAWIREDFEQNKNQKEDSKHVLVQYATTDPHRS